MQLTKRKKLDIKHCLYVAFWLVRLLRLLCLLRPLHSLRIILLAYLFRVACVEIVYKSIALNALCYMAKSFTSTR